LQQRLGFRDCSRIGLEHRLDRLLQLLARYRVEIELGLCRIILIG
jgi:hypothetical protein